MNVMKTILLWAMLAGIAGCAYAPYYDASFGFPVDESSKYLFVGTGP